MNEQKAQINGVLAGAGSGSAAGQLLGYQETARSNYQRQQALHLALQANNGATIPVDTLLANADKILTWLETPNPSGT